MGNGGMRATIVNVNVHAMVYFIDFLNLKKITFIENKTSTQPALWKEQETRLCCKEIWQEYGTFLRDISMQKNGTALSTGTALNYLGQPKETVRKMYESNVISLEKISTPFGSLLSTPPLVSALVLFLDHFIVPPQNQGVLISTPLIWGGTNLSTPPKSRGTY